MVQNIKVKIAKKKITERKNKSKRPKKIKERVIVKSLRKKNKLVEIKKIEETAKKLCASSYNKLKFLNMKEGKKQNDEPVDISS
ncbi:conserved Plasmodium protein, unknown function [Plasmodium chabaudi chabaudi]|uniref:Uncharacterized protein n=2 Tax=Plasmodium chabaudi TaxID=5825 RepID=A0A077TJH7_PLACU|nr:conserved Plasmodium protein, unknown function [Plasmodium chabaudi chabaudi]SCM04877.1 conserved Plasmodium protein, unknown function [Plasmodium chabaudi adami]SCM00587.1 conserved Plasmodium protein, unknown function [Plasmodium chabaudi chabaudi]SCM02014.1 conserved Plasmodium protein, unknown function [Plasmodium chabaudi chabaudi]SCM09072.1 conserved Plasmodium protein, unknown function [Plasmodium chabaudi adami]VTZ68011.1 conserved Plasmodium protein, unknown function [Plasmodium ch|eukprot:XP_016653592.1 conserved Plasmodium protein, unknown function [Plasmodium chabaudi chabaudi]